MSSFEPREFRQKFPLLQQQKNGKPLIYFDNAATTQKMADTISAVTDYYQSCNANVHRAAHVLSAQATKAFEAARDYVANYIHAASNKEIIWTKGTTEAINLLAASLGELKIKKGDEILLSHLEHHANIVPWQQLAKRVGAVIKVIPLTPTGTIDISSLDSLISDKTKLVAVAHISNVIGKINDVKSVIKHAKKVGAVTVVDGAQSIAHFDIDVQKLDCDFFVFSAHKIYGPTGLGVLYGKQALLEQMPPYQTGGEMVDKVSFSGTSFNQLPFKFEAGTPNIASVVAFKTSLETLSQSTGLQAYEQELCEYAYQKLSAIDEVIFVVAGKPDIPIFSFNLEGFHPQDVASYLDAHGICVRSGNHCAMPLFEYIGGSGCVRVSLAGYNTKAEVDLLAEHLQTLLQHEQIELKQGQGKCLSPELNSDNNQIIEQIFRDFDKAKSWDAKHRQIMLYGKALTRMSKSLRDEDSLISGCESDAWLVYQIDENDKVILSCDSDARVVRGLLYIATAPYQNLTKSQLHAFDVESYFSRLGLMQHLSPSRGNGLLSIIDKIKEISY